jgi:hypothetical protein
MNPTIAPNAGPVLRDIHLPPPPGWWPPAPGWWLLAAFVLAICIGIFIYLHRKTRAARQRRAVLRELDRCIHAAHGEPVALAAQLSRFLRRMSLRDAPDAAALTGERWLEHLDRCTTGDEFSRGIGRVLIEAPFRPVMHYDSAALIALVRRWTRQILDQRVAHA